MFEIDGKQFSLERLQQEAAKYNMDFNSYMDKMRKKGLVEIDDTSQSSIGVGILKSDVKDTKETYNPLASLQTTLQTSTKKVDKTISKIDWESPRLKGKWNYISSHDDIGQGVWTREYEVKNQSGKISTVSEIVPTNNVPKEIIQEWEKTSKVKTEIEGGQKGQSAWEFIAGKKDPIITETPVMENVANFKANVKETEIIKTNISLEIDLWKQNQEKIQELNNQIKSVPSVSISTTGQLPLGPDGKLPEYYNEQKKIEAQKQIEFRQRLLEGRNEAEEIIKNSRVGKYLKQAFELWPENEPISERTDEWLYSTAIQLMQRDDEQGLMEKKIAQYYEDNQGIFQIMKPEWANKEVEKAKEYQKSLTEKQKANLGQQNFLANDIQASDKKIEKYISDLNNIDYTSFETELKKWDEQIAALGDVNENSSQEVINEYNRLNTERNKVVNNYKEAVKLYQDYTNEIDNRNKAYQSYLNTINLDTEFNEQGTDLINYINAMNRNGHNIPVALTWVATSALHMGSGIEGVFNAVKELPEDLLFEYYDNDINKMPETVKMMYRVDGVTDAMRNVKKDTFNKFVEGMNASVQAPVKYEDIDSLSDLGAFGLNVVANFVPQYGLMVATGGASIYIMGASAFGNKYDQMEFTNRQVLGKTNYTLGQKWLASGVAFGSEVISESFTYGVFKAKTTGLNKLSYERVKNAFGKNVIETSKRVGKRTIENIPYMYQESVSEAFAELGNNAGDKYVLGEDISLLRGLKGAALSGLFMERAMSMPTLYQDISSVFAGKNWKQKVAENNTKRIAKEKLLAKKDLDPKTREKLENDVLELIAKNETLMAQNIENINMMSNKEKETLVKLNTDIIELRATEDAINADESLSKDQKETLIDDIRTREAELLDRQDDIIVEYETEETRIKKKERFEKQLAQIQKKINKFNKRKIRDFKATNTGARGRVKVFETREEQQAFFNEQISEENALLQAQIDAWNEILKDPTKLNEADKEAIGLEDGDKLLDVHVDQIKNFIKNLKIEIQNNNYNSQMNSRGYGAFRADKYGGFDIFINKENSLRKGGRINTAAHEFLHAVLFQSIQEDSEIQTALGDAVKDFILDNKDGFNRKFIRRMEPYQGDSEFGEEIITIMSESIMDGTLDYKEGLFTKLRDLIRQHLQRLGLRDITFNSGEDVYNFIKDYNASIEKNYDSIAIEKMMDKGAKGKLLRKTQKGRGDGTIMKSKAASDKVQRIYEEQGEDGAFEIIEEFKPIVARIVEKRREAPNFDRELLTSEIEIGKRGIFDLIREYNPKSGVPLAAFINTYLPARAIEASRRVLGEEFTEDVTERVDIAAEEVTTEVKTKRKPKKIVLADRLDIKDEVYKSIDKILLDLNLNELTFKTLKNQIPEIIGKLFGIDPKKIANKANITKSELQSSQMFISKNVDLLISMLPEGATASGTATGVPKTLLKAFYTKTGRAKMAKTGTKAGLAIQQKRKINRKEFLETFGIIDGKPIRTDRNTSARVLALADTLGKMITNQAVRQRAENLTIEAVNRLKDGKSRIMFSKDNVKEITSDVNKKNPQFFKLANVPDINGKPQQQLPKGPVLIQKISEKGEVTFAEGSIKLMDSLWDVDQGITWEQHMSNRINKFLDSHPEYYNILQELLTGGIKRTAYMTVDNFQVLIPKTKKIKEADQIVNERLDYHRTLTAKEKEAGLTGKRLRKNIKTLDRSKDKNKLNNLIKFFQDMSNYLNKDNGKNMTDLWLMDELLKHSSVDQNNFFRKSAQLLGYPIDDNGNPITNQIVVEEHTPINEVIKIAMGAAIRGKVKNIKPLLESLLSQISILEVDDPSGSLKASLGQDFYEKVLPRIISGDLKLKPGHAGIYRLMKHGVNPFRYKLLESDNTIAQEFEVDNLDVDEAKQRIIDYFEGEVTLAYNKAMNRTGLKIQIQGYNKLNNAVNKNRMMASKPSRGITVLDFDDTLATTKSGVRVTMPNPDGVPKPKRKVIFLAGGAGSGKSNVVKQLGLEDQGFKVVNQDISLEWLKKNHGLPEDMRDLTKEQKSTLGKLQAEARRIAKRKMMKFKGQGDGVVIDGTGGSIKVMEKLVNEFKDKGYDVSMLFVETSLDVALERNKARKERSLLDVIVRKNHEAVQSNKKDFTKMFGDRFMEINTDNLKLEDPMPAKLVNKMNDFVSGYERRRLDAEEFALEGADLLAQGAEFDFSEFNIVVEGQTAPLFNKALKLQKKFGPKDMFVLTARPAESAPHIHEFLKANGLNISLKNITGLANSTSEAKALWMADKVAEGYNDFYFADDALQNVQAVQNMLDQFDVKSKVQQAKVKFSKDMNTRFNDILEEVTGIESGKRFSAIKARKRGESKGKFRFFIPPSHEDFVGLLYNFLGKGKKGNKHRDFFEQALVRPLNRAYRELDTAKQSIANDYKSLNKEFKNIKKKLTKKTPDGDFTYQDAIRVYLWNKHGYDIPGLSKTDQQGLVDLVASNAELQVYAETLNVISKQETYVNPTESWEGGDIRTDLDDATGRVGRKQFFAEFFENADIIFSQENLNKIEAAYGADMVSALKDILYRTKTGRNRPSGQNKLVNKFLNYLNGSVASTMFFNIRSAVLQQMSMVNFINFADNNIFKAAAAFANQPQYWKDWATIFNSDFMKQRRGGIKTDVNGAELAASVKDAKNPIQAAIKKLLELGFLPTQIGDNIAIATGGATFYRNRINTYLKQGLSQKEAESKAWTDFRQLAEATQQSARPDMVSQQQASPLGKVILAFQNVTSQFNRLGKKAFLDLKNRRISPEYKNASNPQFQSDLGNISRIAYYFAIQNLIFYSLQSALFMAMFDDDEEDERWLKKKERMINGSIDSVLRGTGVWGAAIATLKNMAIKWHEQRGKSWNKDESAVLMEMLNVSPPLGIKARKLVNAEKTLNYNKKVIDEMETFDIDNPQWSATTNYIEATTNIPLNRLYNKTQNVRESLNNQHNALERTLMFSGWSKWNLGIGDSEKIKEIKEKIKEDKKKKKKKTKTKSKKKKKIRYLL